FPSLHTGHWDPLLQACEETETVVCLHVGSSGSSPNSVLTPHVGYVTEGLYRRFFSDIVEDIAMHLAGTPVRVLNN
ncbi:MAG: hypothetical protein ACKOFD_06875, partial [Actinomycetota bacterium]